MYKLQCPIRKWEYASIEAALRHAHYNYKISPCFLQEQDLLQVKMHAQEKGGGGGGGGEKKARFGG